MTFEDNDFDVGHEFVEDKPRLVRGLNRIRRHLRWGREQGFDRLVEEDNLSLAERWRGKRRRRRWLAENAVEAGAARPVFVVGVQRSGTNMIVRGLEAHPAFEVHNENDQAAFRRFLLRPDADIVRIVNASRHAFVLFKPLCDSHRTDELLDRIVTATPGAALWAYREVDGRARSAVAKFGDVNRRVMVEIVAGRAGHRWQAQRLSANTTELLSALDMDALTPEDGAALFWYARNELYFSLGFADRDDVLPVSYAGFLADPAGVMRTVCAFIGSPYDPELHAHVSGARHKPAAPLDLNPVIRKRCDELLSRLDAAVEQRHAGGS